jgi:hypothetical protein
MGKERVTITTEWGRRERKKLPPLMGVGPKRCKEQYNISTLGVGKESSKGETLWAGGYGKKTIIEFALFLL